MAVSSIWLLKTRLPNINRVATRSTQKCKNHDCRGDVSPGPFYGCLVAASRCLGMLLNSSVLPNTSEMYFKTDSIGVAYRWDGCVGPHLLLALNLALCKLRYDEWKLSHIHFPSSSTYNLVCFCLSTTLLDLFPNIISESFNIISHFNYKSALLCKNGRNVPLPQLPWSEPDVRAPTGPCPWHGLNPACSNLWQRLFCSWQIIFFTIPIGKVHYWFQPHINTQTICVQTIEAKLFDAVWALLTWMLIAPLPHVGADLSKKFKVTSPMLPSP